MQERGLPGRGTDAPGFLDLVLWQALRIEEVREGPTRRTDAKAQLEDTGVALKLGVNERAIHRETHALRVAGLAEVAYTTQGYLVVSLRQGGPRQRIRIRDTEQSKYAAQRCQFKFSRNAPKVDGLVLHCGVQRCVYGRNRHGVPRAEEGSGAWGQTS
ncbi:hypothetical protein D3C77_365750 [compost metagenome]